MTFARFIYWALRARLSLEKIVCIWIVLLIPMLILINAFFQMVQVNPHFKVMKIMHLIAHFNVLCSFTVLMCFICKDFPFAENLGNTTIAAKFWTVIHVRHFHLCSKIAWQPDSSVNPCYFLLFRDLMQFGDFENWTSFKLVLGVVNNIALFIFIDSLYHISMKGFNQTDTEVFTSITCFISDF